MPEVALFGRDFFGDPIQHLGKLRREYVVPPFSIMRMDSDEWQSRKRAWLALGIQSEIGRNVTLGGLASLSKHKPDWQKNDGNAANWITKSIFDPVLCEFCYRSWCPEGGQVIDPFAGGSVRGVVAGALGFNYWGCELREEQVNANREQAEKIDVAVQPYWSCGDSLVEMEESPPADFIFSCPPYGDLEVYSKDERDISNMPFKEFVGAYNKIIEITCNRLKDNRFAAFVVGNFRDKKTGVLRNFVNGTIRAFQECGLHYYNDVVLSTPIGTAMHRAYQFGIGRKIIRTHQNLIVMVKGDWKEAAKASGGTVDGEQE